MSTDIVRQPTDLDSEWRYAQALTTQPERGSTSLLPQAYRGNPANVLIAIGLGKAIGITPAQALYEIYVVNGRPSPSANLMAALVRRAGHRLRVEGDAEKCTATLVRSDDPDFPFVATWTMQQARGANLTGKDTWKSYPAAMLRARAISEVVRMGAPEAVIGMDYSAEEMGDVEQQDRPAPQLKATGVDALRAAVAPKPEPEQPAEQEPVDVTDAEIIEAITDAQLRKMQTAFTAAGIKDRGQRLAYCVTLIGRPLESSKDLTRDEASRVIDALEQDAAEASDEADAEWLGEQA